MRITSRRQLASLALAAIATIALAIDGANAADAPASVNADAAGLALYGYDPVAYSADNKATLGDPAITTSHEGAVYRFASAAHREAFLADPARYLPAYGGYCAYGVAQGYKVKVDPEAWTVVDGRLYLNYDKGAQSQWLQDTVGFITKSESNWPGIKDGPRND
jgi:YHS domain-containing protein